MKRVRKTAYLKALARNPGEWREVPITDEMRRDYAHLKHCAKMWANQRLEVQAFQVSSSIGGVWQITALRHGNLDDVSWEEMQRVIHELFGPEVTAVEVYPSLENEVHFNNRLKVCWILPSTYALPFGLHLKTAWGQPA